MAVRRSRTLRCTILSTVTILACLAPWGSVDAQGSGPAIPNSGIGSDSFHSDAFTGSASFSIPIGVPPGINDMAPNLALTYSTNGPNNWVGLAGLSR